MTIIEAIKTGKRYKRKEDIGYSWRATGAVLHLSIADVLADDWELEPEPEQKITITKKDIDEAWCETFGAYHEATTNRIIDSRDFEAFCKALGFE